MRGGDSSRGLRGFELSAWGLEVFQMQTGLDFAVLDRFAVGPYVSLSFNSYRKVDTSCSGDGCEAFGLDISDNNPTIHLWFFAGVRGRYTTHWL
jgi:hypothetical protein